MGFSVGPNGECLDCGANGEPGSQHADDCPVYLLECRTSFATGPLSLTRIVSHTCPCGSLYPAGRCPCGAGSEAGHA